MMGACRNTSLLVIRPELAIDAWGLSSAQVLRRAQKMRARSGLA